MPPPRIEADHFSADIQDFIRLLHEHQVQYVIAGGEAVIYNGHSRLTGDVDFFYDCSEDNAGSFPVHYLGLTKLIENKRAAGRPKDLQDVEYLGSASENPDSK